MLFALDYITDCNLKWNSKADQASNFTFFVIKSSVFPPFLKEPDVDTTGSLVF